MTQRALRDGLVDHLHGSGAIRTPRVKAAFRAVPRHVFVPDVPASRAYRDEALVTKYGADGRPVSSSSQPAIMAIMLEQLGLAPGQRVLEIGAGTGYNAALLAHAVGPSGHVVTVDIDADLVERARAHLATAGPHANVEVVCADGAFGWPAEAPYDRIILTVGAWDVAPAWHEQLAPGGRLVLPLSLRGAQRSVAFEPADDGHLASISIRDCGFMRLRGALAGPEAVVPLGREPGLFVELEEERPLDGDALYAALGQPRADHATGVHVGARDVWGGLGLWLALREPDVGRLTAIGSVVDRQLVPRLISFPGVTSTDALIGDASLAALVRLASDEPFELGVRPLGAGADELAERLVAHVRGWDAHGRPSTDGLRIRAHTRRAETIDPAATVLDKRHVRLAIDWRARPTVRRADEDDAETLAELNVESWRAAFAGIVAPDFLAAMSVEEQAPRFRRALAGDTGAEVWLAEADRPLGYASLGPSRDDDAEAGTEELYELYVRSDAWRTGVGRLLHERVLERLRARGADRATLWVFDANRRARAFYEALDWTPTRTRREIELAGGALSTVRYGRRVG